MTEERILDFLDGKLDSASEEELLHTLAVSPERRLLLKEHMRIRELLGTLSKEDRFAVPPVVTSELYAKLAQLGLSTGAAVAPIASSLSRVAQYAAPVAGSFAAAGAIIEGIQPGIGFRFSSVVVTGVISFLLGIGVFYFLSNGIAEEPKFAFKSHIDAPIQAMAVTPAASTGYSHHYRIAQPSLAPELARTSVTSGVDFGMASAATLVEPKFAAPEPQIKALSGKAESPVVSGHIGDFAEIATPPEPYVGSGKGDDVGTISFRVGGGYVPSNWGKNLATLTEMKFSWKLFNWIVGRASLGYFVPFEHEANTPTQVNGSWQITTSMKPQTLPVIGAEAGITLDPIHVPVELSGGFMADGSGKMYLRYGAFGHFSMFDRLNVSIGAEGMLYKHDVSQSVAVRSALFSTYNPKPAPGTVMNELSGFIGPALEIGWRF